MVANLLNCGHVCCSQCLDQETPCACCGKKKIVKIASYTRLFTIDVPVQTPKEQLYNFHIVFPLNSRSFDILNLKSSTTIEQILTQFKDFVNFQQRIGNGVGVVISTRSYFYKDIKEKTISQLLNVIVPNHNNRSNTITVLNRLLGGTQHWRMC